MTPPPDLPLLTFLDLHHHLALSNNCFIFIQNISPSLIGSNTSANSWRTVRFPVNGYSCVTAKGPVIIYRLGRRGRILGGITWFLGEKKRGPVVTENQKGGIAENFGRIQRGGTTQICLENEGMWGGGGSRESHQELLGGITQWSNIQREGLAKFHLVLPQILRPLPPPGDK